MHRKRHNTDSGNISRWTRSAADGLNVTSVLELAGVRDRFVVGCEDCASHIIPGIARRRGWHNQRWRAPNTQGGSPVRESCTPGSVRGVLSNGHSYRNSGIEEGGARISQRPKCLLKRLGWPDVVAIEADVLPAEWGNVGERLVRQRFALGAKLCNGAAEVDGVPEDDGGDREVEA